jgi:hypothetical protein
MRLRSQRPLHIACARRSRSSRLTRWWTEKNNWKKWKAEEEERHKGSLTKKNTVSKIKLELFTNMPVSAYNIHGINFRKLQSQFSYKFSYK